MKRNASIVAICPSPRAALCQERTSWPALTPAGRSAAWFIVLLWTVCLAMPLRASELQPLTIALVESSGGSYFEPVGRRIVIRNQPFHLFIRIRNTSEAAVPVRVSPEKAYSLELEDQTGLAFKVKRKAGTGGEEDENERIYLPPGGDQIIPVHISRDTWEGLPDLVAGKEIKYTARAVYETADGKLIYTESYTLIFNISE
jgi:hypothetical protein